MALTDLQEIISAKPGTPAGGVLRGTDATVLPTDATTALDATLKPLGYVTDAGVKIKPNVATTEKKAWGGYVVKVLSTDVAVDTEFSLYQFLNADALRAAYGDTAVVVTPATGVAGEKIALAFKGELPDPAPYVFEAKDRDKRVRVVIPMLQVNDIPEITLDDNTTLDLPIKGKAYPDEDGALMYVYVDMPVEETP